MYLTLKKQCRIEEKIQRGNKQNNFLIIFNFVCRIKREKFLNIQLLFAIHFRR